MKRVQPTFAVTFKTWVVYFHRHYRLHISLTDITLHNYILVIHFNVCSNSKQKTISGLHPSLKRWVQQLVHLISKYIFRDEEMVRKFYILFLVSCCCKLAQEVAQRDYSTKFPTFSVLWYSKHHELYRQIIHPKFLFLHQN